MQSFFCIADVGNRANSTPDGKGYCRTGTFAIPEAQLGR